ncbi:FAD-dependent oxidoreductase [Reinekea marinisedimentorum]|uniref:2-octaprenyl-3-methyl-6-methoxy-1,4-benzoquinol hydroxylase n=1 Tax=Reinekea marinisedimentorum TaxID=230495 RepID=A0A4R3IC42_9GAMM|nr:FAD-dependent oxidoreductase [Reinekea marinisedimentorum]TCS43715.1 2-octaprenyl-3-methyl-6-methoxy-1,4-benzoquinol hydroxylase [Reinekea marinisedimentorum]
MKQRFDVAVVGGGMVGAATALGLAQQGKRVALVEATEPKPFAADQPMDNRVSAISCASVRLLQQLGAWDAIEGMRLAPFRRLETWEQQGSRIRFSAESLGIDELGFIVENRLIQLGLWQQFSQYENLSCFCPSGIESITFHERDNELQLTTGEQLRAALVVGADGANSRVRKLAGIGLTSFDYNHHCMLVNVETEQPQQDITWQWFTPSGPRSFLPLPGNQASLVWYDSPRTIQQLMRLPLAELQQQIVQHFPEELGGIRVISRASFPLTRRHAKSYISDHCVVIGDAAHTINPLAGQGVNLGFKDVQALLHVLSKDEPLAKALKTYQRKRMSDNRLMQAGMDLFYFGFSNDLLPLKLARNAALKTADRLEPLKRKVLTYAIGL